MRVLVLLGSVACTRPLPAPAPAPSEPPPSSTAVPDAALPLPTVAPARSAQELVEAAGVATFVEDQALVAAQIDGDAMERWFTRKPGSVFVYTERALDVAAPSTSVRGTCQRVERWDGSALNALGVVLWRRGDQRTVLELGQDGVDVVDERRDGGTWTVGGARRLPVGAVAWDDAQIRYAEGAELYEVACVPALRTVTCGAGPGRGYCIDRELVVRPWRVPMVPHVGDVIPAYDDPPPDVPEGDCAVECMPSACNDALATPLIPRVRFYAADAPMLAVFRTRAACRAYAAKRTASTDAAAW